MVSIYMMSLVFLRTKKEIKLIRTFYFNPGTSCKKYSQRDRKYLDMSCRCRKVFFFPNPNCNRKLLEGFKQEIWLIF